MAFVRLLNRPLPSQVHQVAGFIFGIPLAILLTKLFAVTTATAGASLPAWVCFLVLVLLLVSLTLCVFTYFVPEFVRSSMSAVLFILWLWLDAGLSLGAFQYGDPRGFTTGIGLTLLALFVMVLLYYQRDIWPRLAKPLPKELQGIVEPATVALAIRSGVLMVLVTSAITFVAMPCIGWNATDDTRSLVLVTTTILHVLTFAAWFMVAVIVQSLAEGA